MKREYENEMDVWIKYADPKYFASFYETLRAVETVTEFQSGIIKNNLPSYYAVDGERVVGWVDISTGTNPRLNHRGGLGMGLLQGYRGQGVGSQLMDASLKHAEKSGLEKVELHVYTSNLAAIALYRRFGFQEEGLIKKYRKLDGRYFDCLMMAKFLR